MFNLVLAALFSMLGDGSYLSSTAVEIYCEAQSRVDGYCYYRDSLGGKHRIMFAPVFVSPQMRWEVPNSSLQGTPSEPGGVPPQIYGQTMGGYRPY